MYGTCAWKASVRQRKLRRVPYIWSGTVLGPVEARLMTSTGMLQLILAALCALFPRMLVYPLFIMFVWLGAALLYRSYTLHWEGKRESGALRAQATSRRAPEEQVEPKQD
jgi:hypothetical protein